LKFYYFTKNCRNKTIVPSEFSSFQINFDIW
jgi:hypothetical protein